MKSVPRSRLRCSLRNAAYRGPTISFGNARSNPEFRALISRIVVGLFTGEFCHEDVPSLLLGLAEVA